MCTVTWMFRDEVGYTVFFNRDELLSRSKALLPTVRDIHGVKVLAPIDPDAGGSWIAVNEYGVLTCLLNRYEAVYQPHPEKLLSRGALVLDLSPVSSWKESKLLIAQKDLSCYPPFQLLQFFPDGKMNGMIWDGRRSEYVTFHECHEPRTGSSFKNREVVAFRCTLYDQMKRVDGSDALINLDEYHHSFNRDSGAYSVNMCRNDAQTVSISRIDVEEGVISYRYESKDRHGFEFGAPSVHRLTSKKRAVR